MKINTIKTRKNIGFQKNWRDWKDSNAVFDSHSLKINNHPVMEDWEDNYMKELADIVSTEKGAVLEIGFGMGISANYIQKRKVREHIIIEANKNVFDEARKFAKKYKKITVIEGFWQDKTKFLKDGAFSGILFDSYPLNEKEIHKNHFPFFKEAYRLLKKGGVLTYYSDEVSDFSKEHRKYLTEAGFKNISSKIINVSPPKDCLYWKHKTILAPIIIK